MNGPRFRITVTRMMVLVAGLAASLGASRAHPSLGSFVSFVVVVGLYRAFAISDRCRAAGKPLSVWESLFHFGSSILVAVTILSVSSAVTLATYLTLFRITPTARLDSGSDWILRYFSHRRHGGNYVGGDHLTLMLISTLLGGYAASLLRRLLWPSRWADRRIGKSP